MRQDRFLYYLYSPVELVVRVFGVTGEMHCLLTEALATESVKKTKQKCTLSVTDSHNNIHMTSPPPPTPTLQDSPFQFILLSFFHGPADVFFLFCINEVPMYCQVSFLIRNIMCNDLSLFSRTITYKGFSSLHRNIMYKDFSLFSSNEMKEKSRTFP